MADGGRLTEIDIDALFLIKKGSSLNISNIRIHRDLLWFAVGKTLIGDPTQARQPQKFGVQGRVCG